MLPPSSLRGVIATDLDRTLTDEHLRAVPAALRRLAEARDQGFATFLVTGRRWAELETRTAFLRSFDGIVVEGGGQYGTPDSLTSVDGAQHLEPLQAYLDANGIPYTRGKTAIYTYRSDRKAVLRYPGLDRLEAVENRDSIDITPPGVHKGSGLERLLTQCGIPSRLRRIAFGDALNDVPLFHVVHHAVAVDNAVPELKAIAHDTTHGYGGHGVARYLHEKILALE